MVFQTTGAIVLPSSKMTKIRNVAGVVGGGVTGNEGGKSGRGKDVGGLGDPLSVMRTEGEAGRIATATWKA
jgi:hypothetical protein